MNTYTSHSTLCCHWCKIPLGNATQVTYLNGNLPICDLCLSKQVTPKFEDATKYCHRIIYRQRKNQRERKGDFMKEVGQDGFREIQKEFVKVKNRLLRIPLSKRNW